MAAVVPAVDTAVSNKSKKLVRYSGTGAANTDATLTTTAVVEHHAQRVLYASAVYGSAVTQTGVTFGVDSGLGATFDFILLTGSANAAMNVFAPDYEVWLFPGDAFVITALAGGSGDIATITVVVEET